MLAAAISWAWAHTSGETMVGMASETVTMPSSLRRRQRLMCLAARLVGSMSTSVFCTRPEVSVPPVARVGAEGLEGTD